MAFCGLPELVGGRELPAVLCPRGRGRARAGPCPPRAVDSPAPACHQQGVRLASPRGPVSQGPLSSGCRATSGEAGKCWYDKAALRVPCLCPTSNHPRAHHPTGSHLPDTADPCLSRQLPLQWGTSRHPCLALLLGLPRPWARSWGRCSPAALSPSPPPVHGSLSSLTTPRDGPSAHQGSLVSWPFTLQGKWGPLEPMCCGCLLTSQRSGTLPSASTPNG